MTIKEIRTTLMTKDKVTFNIQGVTEYQCIDKETNEFSYAPKILKTHRFGKDSQSTSITCRYGINGMNVTKFGPTSFTVYSFDLLSNRTRSRIKYEDVTIVTD
jgi:hypothetical protein